MFAFALTITLIVVLSPAAMAVDAAAGNELIKMMLLPQLVPSLKGTDLMLLSLFSKQKQRDSVDNNRIDGGQNWARSPAQSTTSSATQCCQWATQGECDKNPYYMKVQCKKECGTPTATLATAGSTPTNLTGNGCGGAAPPQPQPQPQAQLQPQLQPQPMPVATAAPVPAPTAAAAPVTTAAPLVTTAAPVAAAATPCPTATVAAPVVAPAVAPVVTTCCGAGAKRRQCE